MLSGYIQGIGDNGSLSDVQNEATLSFSRVDKFTRSSSRTHDCAPFEKEVMEPISRKVSNIVRFIFTSLIIVVFPSLQIRVVFVVAYLFAVAVKEVVPVKIAVPLLGVLHVAVMVVFFIAV